MASNSIVTKVGDGVTDTWSFSFTDGYRSDDEVLVRVGLEVDGAGGELYRDTVLINSGTIQVLGPVPAVGEDVKIFRKTDITEAANDFAAGDVLSDVSLDDGFRQLIHAAQELEDALGDSKSAAENAAQAEASAAAAAASEASASSALTQTISSASGASLSASQAWTYRNAAEAAQAATEAALVNATFGTNQLDMASDAEANSSSITNRVMSPRATRIALNERINETNQRFSATNISLSSVEQIYNHGLGGMPDMFMASLQCTVSNNGYVAGQVVPQSAWDADGTTSQVIIWFSATQVGIKVPSTIQMRGHSVGSLFTVDPAQWKLRMNAERWITL